MLSERQRLRRERQQLLVEKETRQRAEKLLRLLEELDEPENHDFAIYQIMQLGPDTVVDSLIKTLLIDDDPDARYGSARALGQICQEHQLKSKFKTRATQALITALDDAEAAVRYWAAGALGKCGNQSAVEALGPLLKDKHRGVRDQAERVLEQIGGEHANKLLSENKKKGLFDWLKGS
jgi:HEAT repeat protein